MQRDWYASEGDCFPVTAHRQGFHYSFCTTAIWACHTFYSSVVTFTVVEIYNATVENAGREHRPPVKPASERERETMNILLLDTSLCQQETTQRWQTAQQTNCCLPGQCGCLFGHLVGPLIPPEESAGAAQYQPLQMPPGWNTSPVPGVLYQDLCA